MPYTNIHRGARISPTKVRPVIDMIRGRQVEDALAVLQVCKRRAAVLIGQSLNAAIANAYENNPDVGDLVVSEARVDQGPTMKRWQPKDRGRAHPIKKRTSHIRVSVDEADRAG